MSTLVENLTVNEGGNALSVGKISQLRENKVMQAVKDYKQLGFNLILSEIALLSGVSTRTINELNSAIKSYWSAIESATDASMCERVIGAGLTRHTTVENALGIILGTFLRCETSILSNLKNLKSVWKAGKHIIGVYKQVCNRKNGKGVPISSSDDSIRYLLNNIDFDSLFIRPDSYSVGSGSVLEFRTWR